MTTEGAPASEDGWPDHVPLGGDWWLWRDFAVRSAGFPVTGLDAFGPGDEPARLAAVARDPAFREAVTWQNPQAAANALAKIAQGDAPASSKTRRREEIVASYWQRYSAKNDTIGFFGPLAWGRIDEGCEQPVRTRAGELVRERSVHFEAWPLQLLATSLGGGLRVPLGLWPEGDLRARLERHEDPELRMRGLAALDRLETARDAVAAADGETLAAALAALDEVFVALTDAAPTRNHGRAYGARTLAYIDCMRDLDVRVGPPLLRELAPGVRTLFEAGRWYCGRIHTIGRAVVSAALPEAGSGPFGPMVGRVLGPLMKLPSEIGAEVDELQRRMAALVADPDPATLAERAAAAFADHAPAWALSEYQSVDVQIAARDQRALEDGDYLAVLADAHPGDNPLCQAFFAHRHPEPERFARLLVPGGGRAAAFLMPPWRQGMMADSRGVPVYGADAVHIAINPESSAPDGIRTWRAEELWVDGEDVVDRSGSLRVPAVDVFALPIFVASVRTFDPWPTAPHTPRLSAGRVVLRRETWNVPAGQIPAAPAELPAWAVGLGMPRRVFVKTAVERKPMLLDLESPVLARVVGRHVRASAEAAPGEPVRFTEMLPAPDECWLTDGRGRRYACELRLVAVDATRAAAAGAG